MKHQNQTSDTEISSVISDVEQMWISDVDQR